VWLRRLATDRMTRSRSSASAEDAPLVIAAEVKSALRLAAVNDAAARLGLKPGMALADARAMYPTIAVANADPEADARLLVAIADWCDRYTPLIGLDPPDGLVLDVTGCAHLFGGEAALCRDLVRRLALQGFHARVAIADTVGCAFAVARYDTALIVPVGETRASLLALPLAALRIAPDVVAALAQVGLKRIADVVERPRAPLAARFGEHFVRRIDQALGRDDEPIEPRLPVPPYVAERRFADPILLEGDVLRTIEQLAHELARLMERRGEGARRLEAALFRTDGKVHRIALGTGAPLREGARIRALFAERLAAVADDCDPGFGFDVIRLSALATERADPAQTGLAAPDHAAELAHLVDRLGARFGLRRVTRLVPQDTHIPEFAVAAVPASENRRPRTDNRNPSSVFGRLSSDQDSLAPARPIHLFERPEPIEAIAEVPDGPPVRFRWRRVLHQVAHAEGPERIAMQWWRDEQGRALTRDYFRVESNEGVRVWLYREGFYNARAKPNWFLHGLFA
jgi:protein ImuB